MKIQENKPEKSLDSVLHKNDPLNGAKCCDKDIAKEEIIRLCPYIDVQFKHLEMSVNMNETYHCTNCNVPLSLKQKKPLLKWNTNRTALLAVLKGSCSTIFKILIFILYKFSLIIAISYLITLLDVSKIGIPVLGTVIILLFILVCPIFYEMRVMIHWIKSVCELCQRWCENSQEMKVEPTKIIYEGINEEI